MAISAQALKSIDFDVTHLFIINLDVVTGRFTNRPYIRFFGFCEYCKHSCGLFIRDFGLLLGFIIFILLVVISFMKRNDFDAGLAGGLLFFRNQSI